MINVSDLIGIPYKEHGRSKEGFDCYGLVMEVEKRIGVYLPDFDYETHTDELTDGIVEDIKKSGKAKRIPQLVDGALVLFKNSQGLNAHIGVYVGEGQICHCNRRGVHVDSSRVMADDMEGIYIWQK